jgi:hypothetical protein
MSSAVENRSRDANPAGLPEATLAAAYKNQDHFQMLPLELSLESEASRGDLCLRQMAAFQELFLLEKDFQIPRSVADLRWHVLKQFSLALTFLITRNPRGYLHARFGCFSQRVEMVPRNSVLKLRLAMALRNGASK